MKRGLKSAPILLSLGSNIDPEENLRRALRRLGERVSIVAGSTLYRSAPVGAPGTPEFYNAAIELESELSAVDLKWDVLRTTERELGRVRTEDRNAPRPIDLDLAIYGDLSIDDRGAPERYLRLPDPDIVRFQHVARPLADLRPDYRHPRFERSLAQIADALERDGGATLHPLGPLLNI